MRRIAYCLVAAGVVLSGSLTLMKHFASKPTDPNLAELGLADNVETLTAPDDPTPATQASTDSSLVPNSSEVIDLYAKPLAPVASPSAAPADPEVKLASFIDTPGAAELARPPAFQWMPLCRDPEIGASRHPSEKESPTSLDRMPRCDEHEWPQSSTGENKPH